MSRSTTRRSVLEPLTFSLVANVAIFGCARGDARPGTLAPSASTINVSVAPEQPQAREPRDSSGMPFDGFDFAASCTGAYKLNREQEAAIQASLLGPVADSTHDAVGQTPFRIEVVTASRSTRGEPFVAGVIRLYSDAPHDCRMALFFPNENRAEIIATPPSAELPGCGSPRLLSCEDLNEDGVPDFAFVVDVPHNRYPVRVDVGRVYLSRVTSSTVTYCEAPKLDFIAQTSRENGVGAGVMAERRRLGDTVLECSLPMADAGPGGWGLAPSR